VNGWNGLYLGLLIAVCGFFGDVVISCVKRDLRIKDTGSFIPGHGGILDRIDSLLYTVPIFFHFINYFY
jgi:phosphatidate cytidylyltransferase